MRLPLLTLCLSAVLTAGAQAAFVSSNNMLVSGQTAEFEVFARANRTSGPNFFCAASEYARRALGASPADRLLVTRALSPSLYEGGRESMAFRLVAQGEPVQRRWTLLLLPRRSEGVSRSVAHAAQLCDDR